MEDSSPDLLYDVIIIGGGVVGIAALRAATLAGWKCALIEKEPDLLSHASGNNSGIICTGVDAAPGTLERSLIRDSISQIRPFLKAHNVPSRACGSLVCQWEWDKLSATGYRSPTQKVLSQSHDAGDMGATKLAPHELGQMEPNVSTLCVGAVHIPGEIVVDPWLYSIALAAHARENGARIITSFEFDSENTWFQEDSQIWNVVRKSDMNEVTEYQLGVSLLRATAIVNATGIMADIVQNEVVGVASPVWQARPRRGQYRVYSADNVTNIHHPIQPVPTQETKGIFCFSTLYDQIIVGPTAEDQESRHDCSPNPQVGDDLTTFALRIIPDLDPHTQYIGEFVGVRPGSTHRDYQIYLSARRKWVVAAGIRSTGLTASLGIGRHVVHLLQSVLPIPSRGPEVWTTPLPSLKELVLDYHKNKQGFVRIHGYIYRVTHPLTRFGWDAKSGLAAAARLSP
jgi:glycerol-3-phosphate dehydrogenase